MSESVDMFFLNTESDMSFFMKVWSDFQGFVVLLSNETFG